MARQMASSQWPVASGKRMTSMEWRRGQRAAACLVGVEPNQRVGPGHQLLVPQHEAGCGAGKESSSVAGSKENS